MSKCLVKEPKDRWTASKLLSHEFLAHADQYKDNFKELVSHVVASINKEEHPFD
jgi:serine/threonine protein kinase